MNAGRVTPSRRAHGSTAEPRYASNPERDSLAAVAAGLIVAGRDAPDMPEPGVDRSFSEPHTLLTCRCGWEGHDDDIERWDVQRDSDRVVRQCPSCSDPVPEWGTIRPVDAAARIARGPLRRSLVEAGVLDG